MSTIARLPKELRYEALELAHSSSSDVVRRTPMLTSASLSARGGGVVSLKAENLQRTGSFKLRGALNKLRAMSGASGVVAGSAGNHAQSLAYAARAYGVPCEVFMPVDAAVSKLAAVRAFGASVFQEGDSVDACVELARTRAAQNGSTFVHPFDDADVVGGQAGVGVELLKDVPDLSLVVVPVGGGGLIAGVSAAIRQRRSGVRIVGVQAERCAPFPGSLRAETAVAASSVPTIADGIAIKRPGNFTLPLVRQLVDDFVTVSDSAIAEAMVLLLERSKLVVEGAGAAGVAALLTGAVSPAASGSTVLVLSGGNVDVALLAAVAARQETHERRRVRLYTRISDRPGGLAGLLATVADAKANLIAVDHVRDGVELDVGETGVELTLATRGAEHTSAVRAHLAAQGYVIREV